MGFWWSAATDMATGVDPTSKHVGPPKPRRYRGKRKDPSMTPTTPTPSSVRGKSKSGPKPTSRSVAKKRRADGSSGPNPRATKKSKTNGVSKSKANAVSTSRRNSVSRQARERYASLQAKGGGDDGNLPPLDVEFNGKLESALQVCRYLLEMLSVPLLRSHATAGLVDRDRLQLYHANRSVILVSSAINFSEEDGKSKFIATIIAFHCLSLEQNGILETRVPRNAEIVSQDRIANAYAVQEGSELVFPKKEQREAFTVKLGEVISRDPAMIGRSTVVLNATSDMWQREGEHIPLVVKISWPACSRRAETEFLSVASNRAKDEHEWASKHLPCMYYSEDVVPAPGSTLENVACLFDKPQFGANNRSYVYERRTLRIIIQERLHAFKSLGSVKDIGQVLVDVACGTCVIPVFDS